MRWLTAFVTVAAIAASTPALAQEQESLCNPCVDAPINRINRGGFQPVTPGTTVITAEQMRSLGVVSVADMVRELQASKAAVTADADAAAGPDAAAAAATDAAAPAPESPSGADDTGAADE
jgi:hypothetical protein